MYSKTFFGKKQPRKTLRGCHKAISSGNLAARNNEQGGLPALDVISSSFSSWLALEQLELGRFQKSLFENGDPSNLLWQIVTRLSAFFNRLVYYFIPRNHVKLWKSKNAIFFKFPLAKCKFPPGERRRTFF